VLTPVLPLVLVAVLVPVALVARLVLVAALAAVLVLVAVLAVVLVGRAMVSVVHLAKSRVHVVGVSSMNCSRSSRVTPTAMHQFPKAPSSSSVAGQRKSLLQN
jgi:hypothetical protein